VFGAENVKEAVILVQKILLSITSYYPAKQNAFRIFYVTN